MKKFVEVSCMVSLLYARRTLASDICSYAASEAQGGSGEGVCGGVAEQFTGKCQLASRTPLRVLATFRF